MYSKEHHIISSSDDEQAVVPLKLIQSSLLTLPEPTEDPNSYAELYKYSMEKCEFCDSIFHCRYDVIIHNSKHIIVPLINQTTFKCNVCLHIFTSERELHNHKHFKHNLPKILPSFKKETGKEMNVKHENIKKMPKVLENFVKKEPVVKCDDSVDLLMKSTNLKSRLVFEDDVICLDDEEPPITKGDKLNATINNLILDIVNSKLEQTLNGAHSCYKTQDATPKLKVLLPSQVNLEKLQPSVHFEQLVKPGLYRCKRCTKTFPNRFILISHETTHIRLKKGIKSHLCTLCDRHIAGSQEALDNHHKMCHPVSISTRNYHVSTCHLCNLKFHNSLRHTELYHKVYQCRFCNLRFFSSTELSEHYNECKQSFTYAFKSYTETQTKIVTKVELGEHFDILRVCEVCALFFKDKHNVKYICIGENSKLQCDQVCEQCNKEAYVIKLIKRVKINTKLRGPNKVKSLSNNENRLKNIQQRLKMMNKFSRF